MTHGEARLQRMANISIPATPHMAEAQKMPEQRYSCTLLGLNRDMHQATEHLEQLRARIKKISLAYPAYMSAHALAFFFEKEATSYLLDCLNLGKIQQRHGFAKP